MDIKYKTTMQGSSLIIISQLKLAKQGLNKNNTLFPLNQMCLCV